MSECPCCNDGEVDDSNGYKSDRCPGSVCWWCSFEDGCCHQDEEVESYV